MVKPIPKAILIHSVEYEEYKGKDRYGDEFKEPVTLENVLVQPVSSIKRNNISDAISYKSLMFYDCVYSTPRNINFTEKSRVVFNGDEMIIGKVNPIYTFGIHHYELELI